MIRFLILQLAVFGREGNGWLEASNLPFVSQQVCAVDEVHEGDGGPHPSFGEKG